MSEDATIDGANANSNVRITRSRAPKSLANQPTMVNTATAASGASTPSKSTFLNKSDSISSNNFANNKKNLFDSTNASNKFNKKLNDTEQKIKDKINQMPAVLSNHQLKNLDAHKYSSTGNTLLDPLFQPYWRWLVEKMPLWLAPNAITIIGLIINLITSTILIFYSPNATDHVKRILYFFVFF